MKKLISFLVAFAMTAGVLSAQVAPGMKYKDLKDRYSAKEYVKMAGDPYSAGWSGFASFVIPGLGQVINGETGRGLAIFGGDVALGVVGSVCGTKMLSYVELDANKQPVKDSNGDIVFKDKKAAAKWFGAMMGVGVAALVYDIWNICDAVKVAKVKNMYYQDLAGLRSLEMNLYPSVDYAMTAGGTKLVPGMTLSVQF